jgi:hypothetical protein
VRCVICVVWRVLCGVRAVYSSVVGVVRVKCVCVLCGECGRHVVGG